MCGVLHTRLHTNTRTHEHTEREIHTRALAAVIFRQDVSVGLQNNGQDSWVGLACARRPFPLALVADEVAQQDAQKQTWNDEDDDGDSRTSRAVHVGRTIVRVEPQVELPPSSVGKYRAPSHARLGRNVTA